MNKRSHSSDTEPLPPPPPNKWTNSILTPFKTIYTSLINSAVTFWLTDPIIPPIVVQNNPPDTSLSPTKSPPTQNNHVLDQQPQTILTIEHDVTTKVPSPITLPLSIPMTPYRKQISRDNAILNNCYHPRLSRQGTPSSSTVATPMHAPPPYKRSRLSFNHDQSPTDAAVAFSASNHHLSPRVSNDQGFLRTPINRTVASPALHTSPFILSSKTASSSQSSFSSRNSSLFSRKSRGSNTSTSWRNTSDQSTRGINTRVQRAISALKPLRAAEEKRNGTLVDQTGSHTPNSIISINTTPTNYSRKSSHQSSSMKSWTVNQSDYVFEKLILSSKFTLPTAEEIDFMYARRLIRTKLMRSSTSIDPTVISVPESELLQRLIDRDLKVDRELQAHVKRTTQWVWTKDRDLEVESMFLNCISDLEKVWAQKANVAIKGLDFATLAPCEWLNDEIINGYGYLISQRALTHSSLPALPTVRVLSSFFWSRLAAHTTSIDDGFLKVKTWTRQKSKQILNQNVQLMLFPIHLGAHWCFGCINFIKKRIEYYDSLHGRDPHYFQTMRAYLRLESLDKLGCEFDFDGWHDYYPKDEIPRQFNSYDCGVFTCAIMEHVSRQVPMVGSFDQSTMSIWRRRVFYELLHMKLIT